MVPASAKSLWLRGQLLAAVEVARRTAQEETFARARVDAVIRRKVDPLDALALGVAKRAVDDRSDRGWIEGLLRSR